MKRLKLLPALGLMALLAGPVHASELNLLWYVDGDEQRDILQTFLDRYTQSHPDTTFKVQIAPYGQMIQKFQQFAASGIMPDLSLTSSMEPVIRPFLVDLNTAIGPDYINNFVKGWADGAKYNGETIAAPLQVTSTGIFYNVDDFKKAGVDLPSQDKSWTWDEAVAALKKVAKASGARYPLVWDVSASRWIVYQFESGNHIFSTEAPVKVVMDDAAWTEALKKFIAMSKDAMPRGLWSGASSDNPKQLFMTGQAVAYMSGSWQITGLAKDASFDWQAGPTPYETVRSSIYGGDYLVAFKSSPYLKEDADFIKWMTSPEIQADWSKAMGMIPANLHTPDVDFGSPQATKAVHVMQAELNDSPAYAATDQAWPEMQAVWGPMKQYVTEAVAGQLTPEQAIKRLHQAADDAVAAASGAE